MSEIAQTIEAVAYALMGNILHSEGKLMTIPAKGIENPKPVATRKDILDTYCECPEAVKGNRIISVHR